MFNGYKPSVLTYGVLGATNAFICFFIAAVTRREGLYILIWTIFGFVWIVVTIRWLFFRRAGNQPRAKSSL
jgi:hypothetical protein